MKRISALLLLMGAFGTSSAQRTMPQPYCLGVLTANKAQEVSCPCIVQALGKRQFMTRTGSSEYGRANQSKTSPMGVVVEQAVVIDGSPYSPGALVNLVSTSVGSAPLPTSGLLFSHGVADTLSPACPMVAGQRYFILGANPTEGRLPQPFALQDLAAATGRKSMARVLPVTMASAPYVAVQDAHEIALLNAFPTKATRLVTNDAADQEIFENLIGCWDAVSRSDLIRLTNFLEGFRPDYTLANSMPDDRWAAEIRSMAAGTADPFVRFHAYKILVVWSRREAALPFLKALLDMADDASALVDKTDPTGQRYDAEEHLPRGVLERAGYTADKEPPPIDMAKVTELALSAKNPGVRHYLQEEFLDAARTRDIPLIVAKLDDETPAAQEVLLWRLSSMTHTPQSAPRARMVKGVHVPVANRAELIEYWKKRFPKPATSP